MDYLNFNIKSKKPVDVVLLGDIHLGSHNCNEALFDKTIQSIKKNKDTRVILMGDLIEFNQKYSNTAGVYEQTLNPNAQISSIIKKLTPIKKQILFSHNGNHEHRSEKHCGIQIGSLIANALGVPFVKNMALTDIKVNSVSYRFFTWHGAGASQSTAGRIKILQRQAETFVADLYAMGHVHELASAALPRREVVKGKFKDIFNQYILTGGYLNWDDSYCEEFGYKMVKTGSPKITLNNKEKELSVDLNYACGNV